MTATDQSTGRAVRVRVGDAAVALAAGDVAEVVRRPSMIRVPYGPTKLAGLANLRGIATPIFSLSRLLDRPDGGEAAWVVVMNRKPALGLLVDRVEAVSDGDTCAPGVITVGEDGKGRAVALNDLLADQAAAVRTRSAIELPDRQQAAQEQRGGATVAMLSFTVADQNYALPLTDIVEVAPLPASLRAGRRELPVKITIRGRKVDLIFLRTLLGLGDAAISGNERIIVVDIDGKPAGLVVDGARTILRAPETSISGPPARLNRESDSARIQSVVRMPDGLGVVSMLTVASLFHAAREHTEAMAENHPRREIASEDIHRFIVFRIGDENYGYPIEEIGEIVRPPETMTRMPGVPDYVLGVVNLRGGVVPILDQRQRFGAAAARADRDDRILVVDIGGMRTGLLVDGVSDIRQVAAGQIGAAPELTAGRRSLFDRVITARQNEHMILVVDPTALLSDTERGELAGIGGTATETAHL